MSILSKLNGYGFKLISIQI